MLPPPPDDAVADARALSAAVSDEALVARSRQGDEPAWEMLARRYHPLVVSVARSHRLPDHDVLDVVGSVFGELWRSLAQLNHPGQVRAWLVTVTRRQCLAQMQYQRRWVNLAEFDLESAGHARDLAPQGETRLLDAERDQAMRVALARLAPRCRRLLEWLFFSDPPPGYDEIGRRLGVAGNSIGFIRGRCLRKLRDAFEAELAAGQPDRGPRG